MADCTLYERNNRSRMEQAGGICFGVVTEVFADRRLCSVSAYGGSGGLQDQCIPECQWIDADSNPAGGESTSIPRNGSHGIIVFVDGEPFIIGYFRGMNGDLGAATGDETPAVQGDKIIKGIGGNRIRLLRSGLVEVFSKETLKRIYMPTNSLLIDICRNYELKADGGFKKWTTTSPLNTTKFTAEYRQNMARLMVVYDEIGNVDSTTIYRRSMGPTIPSVEGVPAANFKHEVKATGENIIQISPLGIGGITASFKPTGEMSIATGLAPVNQFKLSVGADGTTEIAVNNIGKVSIASAGDIKAENKTGSVSLSAAGDIALKNKLGAVTVSAAGKFTVKGAAAELLDLFNQHLTEQINILTALQALTVGTGTGPSSPPINLADFAKAMSNVVKIQTALATIKG